MLRISDISYSIAGRPLFEGASAVIPEGHKVGLIGANGTGKTTLFKLIRRELVLEGGSISLPSKARIGGVAQEVPASSTSLLDTVLAADTERAELMADDSTDPTRIAEIQTRLADIDAWSAEARAATILKGLGFDDAEQLKPCSDFSGGWRMRVALAAVLFSQPDLLLLDEPTNYLDLEGALWLEAYLAKYPHTVIIISHDRGLLNRAVGAILHLEERQLTYYSGPYDQFARQRAERRAVQAAMAKKQQARREHMQSFVDRFKAKASKAKQAQSRLKMIEKMDMIAAPEEAAKRVFTFPEPEELSPPIINIEGGTTGYGDTVILSKLNLRIDQDDRIALLGKNGQGKSTLSKLLSDRLPLMSGKATRSTKLRIGYFAQHQVDELHIDETSLQHLQSLRPGVMQSKLRATLAGFGLGADQADTAVGRLSGGQKARLSLLLATIDAPHLLILDEPTNHLDIESREALVEALTAYTGAVILVSHDMHLLGLVADRLWLVSNGTVQPYDEDLEAYRKMLLSVDKPAKPAKVEAPKAKRPSREKVLELRAEARKSEARVDKLNEMRDKLAKKLADPALYDDSKKGEAEVWQKKYAEVMNALDRAEAMWMAALEKLEGADAV
ncbi:ABC-F family ATP-binding cassette domain-containing protein [Pseudosulfitobacter pseudonitzschiae]|uniref:ABC-F family ATP-binding cassette domain-containing protein n=1 Tax=Pseudosulfitobacter pseudonitzschiae TaxID=1402135 RepID=UPI001AF2EA44|nr:ABC-F family ATP-binding cassette domain-containing protein [Pseudosulfitobacter pseudonitzschiae]MBM1814658.1 ABC-F family ATP-binding cassette domain-containing protein [Pseudosulfitobacter pseudonitzschiae]MBM1831652.1 ABC-F family ATP-binding cassette domain-containing protein [Pseudosulfitobacter pseudonitzschiae]MBM1836517.1 ABC-F family ATP-binding cassette domain-containing protein [Pseudosulfitobacter pseudonitzschiae]MBM1841364.1 ABC-F family ATP-binding cassette domain-containing 